MGIMVGLAHEMHVELHPRKSLEIVPGLRNARALPRPFFSGLRLHYGGTVQICCTLLCGLDGPALGGVLAHELAHLKRRHQAKALLSLLAFGPISVYVLVSGLVAAIPILLSFAVFGLVISLISWQSEYEADAVAALYVGEKRMAYALEQVAQLLHRRRDTFTHPSFRRRVSRLLSDKE
jgi:Zn-dependent protease with chaperone function